MQRIEIDTELAYTLWLELRSLKLTAAALNDRGISISRTTLHTRLKEAGYDVSDAPKRGKGKRGKKPGGALSNAERQKRLREKRRKEKAETGQMCPDPDQ